MLRPNLYWRPPSLSWNQPNHRAGIIYFPTTTAALHTQQRSDLQFHRFFYLTFFKVVDLLSRCYTNNPNNSAITWLYFFLWQILELANFNEECFPQKNVTYNFLVIWFHFLTIFYIVLDKVIWALLGTILYYKRVSALLDAGIARPAENVGKMTSNVFWWWAVTTRTIRP